MRTFAILLLSVFLSSNLMAQDELTPDVVFLSYFKIKGEQINKKQVIAFLDRYYEEEHSSKLSDKGAYKAYITEKLSYYNTQLATFPYNKGFVAQTVVSLKDYDKEKQAFNLELEHYFERGIINPSDKWGGKLDYVGKAANYENYLDFKVDCDQLVDLFVNASPSVSKDSIPVTISISFYGAVNDETNQFGSSELFTGYVMCKINKLTFHFSDDINIEYKK